MTRILAQNPIEAALYEMEHLGLGDIGVLKRKAVTKTPRRILPVGGAGATPRTAAEIQLESERIKAEAAGKSQPSLIESTMAPFVQLGMIGIGAILAVNLLPPILEALSRKRKE